jgi:hypothetical protein
MSDDDCTKLSDDDLLDILTRMDRERFPERYKAVRDEYSRRHRPPATSEELDRHFEKETTRRPFAERATLRLGCLVIVLACGLISLLVRLVMYLVSLV